jgi:Hypoxia induced protein conserved region
MKTFLTILVGLGLLATFGVLVAGMVGMARGGGNPQRSNKLMQYRVILQAVTLLLFALLMLLLRG